MLIACLLRQPLPVACVQAEARPQSLRRIHVLQDRLQAVLESMRQQAAGTQLSKSHDVTIVKQLQAQSLDQQKEMESLQDNADRFKAKLEEATMVSSCTQARTSAEFDKLMK